jgi:hypothetical protein
MELYVVAGGQIDSVNRWVQDLNSQFLPIYENGKPSNGDLTHRRLLVAPIQLYKICFPKEELENVMAMVCPTDYINKRYKILDKGINFIRKILGLKVAPMPKYENPFLQPNQVDKAVFVVPVGLKEDEFSNGKEII